MEPPFPSIEVMLITALRPYSGDPKPRSPERELGATNLQLTSAEIREIDAAFASLTVHGIRMNEMQMGFFDDSTTKKRMREQIGPIAIIGLIEGTSEPVADIHLRI